MINLTLWNPCSFKTMLDMLIHRCPRLEDLQLYQRHAFVDMDFRQLFKHGRWPMLKKLSLVSDMIPPTGDGVYEFFDAHPTLEHIFIPKLTHITPVQRMENIPNVRSLGCVHPLHLNVNIFTHLEFLALDFAHGWERYDFGILALPRLSVLRCLSLNSVQFPSLSAILPRIARAVPNLERLHFNHEGGWDAFTVPGILNDEDGVSALLLASLYHPLTLQWSFSARIAILSGFHSLTHLSGLQIWLMMNSQSRLPVEWSSALSQLVRL
jgi:hypothetical protein